MARKLATPDPQIFAYLLAALGWKISCGQQRPIEAGILNDFTAIATYAPYVDAMFADKEFAELLTHARLRADLQIKAKVFSLTPRDDFLQYLTDLAAPTPKEVCDASRELYGIDD